MKQDLLGYAFYSTLHDLLQHRAERIEITNGMPRGLGYLEFTDVEIEKAASLFRDFLAERVASFEINFIRIMGLISSLKPFCQTTADRALIPWWLARREFADSRDVLRRFVADLESIYADERLEEFQQQITDIDSTVLVSFLKQLRDIVQRYRTATPLPLVALQQAAEEYVSAEFATGPLTCLGVGEEGVVLTDGRRVYKYFHYWKARDRSERVAFLKSLAGKVSGYRSLPDLLEVREQGDQVVVVYPYEEGTK